MSHHTSSLAHASFFFDDIVDALLAPKHRLPLHLSSLTCRYIFWSRPRSPWHDIRLKFGSLRLVTSPACLSTPTQRRVRAMVPINPPVSSPTTGNGSCYTAHKLTSLSSHVRCMYFTHPIPSALINVTRYCIPTRCLPPPQFTESESASARPYAVRFHTRAASHVPSPSPAELPAPTLSCPTNHRRDGNAHTEGPNARSASSASEPPAHRIAPSSSPPPCTSSRTRVLGAAPTTDIPWSACEVDSASPDTPPRCCYHP
ncbi:hypothetical protein B0H13DRAFT_2354175 [Mycena leptocephala]|nr:hypothetical protein B0H13DRAFT_2354175 [Mycena leptocephala]